MYLKNPSRGLQLWYNYHSDAAQKAVDQIIEATHTQRNLSRLSGSLWLRGGWAAFMLLGAVFSYSLPWWAAGLAAFGCLLSCIAALAFAGWRVGGKLGKAEAELLVLQEVGQVIPLDSPIWYTLEQAAEQRQMSQILVGGYSELVNSAIVTYALNCQAEEALLNGINKPVAQLNMQRYAAEALDKIIGGRRPRRRQ